MTEDINKAERPRICSIDLESSVFSDIESHGYNLYQGTLGSVVKVPNKTRHDSAEILLNQDFPDNFHEYDILILDLTNENRIDYNPFQQKITDTKSKSIYRLVCSYPTTIFDPRPLSASFLEKQIHQIRNRKFVQIIFACADYEIEYEINQITNRYSDKIPNEKHSIYSFWADPGIATSKYGKEVTLCDSRNEFHSLLEKHIGKLEYQQTFHQRGSWLNGKFTPDKDFIPLLKNINGEIVSFVSTVNNLTSFVFPNIADKADVLIELLKHILPTFYPELFPYSTQFIWKNSPEYFLPNHNDLIAERTEIENEFAQRLTESQNKIKENISKFEFLHELVTETGENLVIAVLKFLKWLEFKNVTLKDEEAKSLKEEDLQVTLDHGILIIETKGIGGTSTDNDCSQISKIKHRRCKERNAFDVWALYLVNHQRYLPPLNRRNPPFTDQQIADAVSDERGLLSTWQLFNLYFDIKDGLLTKEEAKHALLKYGLIEFKPKVVNRLNQPKQILKEGQVVILDLIDTQLTKGQILIGEKNNRYFKTTILSIQLDGNSVDEVKEGEVGIRLDKKISKGTELWTI